MFQNRSVWCPQSKTEHSLIRNTDNTTSHEGQAHSKSCKNKNYRRKQVMTVYTQWFQSNYSQILQETGNNQMETASTHHSF